jgi:hypothetical protein
VSLAPAARRNDHIQCPSRHMAKAARVLAALTRDGWTETRRRRRIVSSPRTIGSAAGLTMRALTWAGRRWPGSPQTTATPLLSYGSYRTMTT